MAIFGCRPVALRPVLSHSLPSLWLLNYTEICAKMCCFSIRHNHAISFILTKKKPALKMLAAA
jgi:hypothetical protein